ncbi:RNA polymerase sigma factor [Alkalihalobacillus sp. TS-13]|uniref:RNA polymerase sigma factor n=1 Tax=Alkalihalobacillus sp. TS-13 TaxID=2842455 RepID=UPI001C868EC0|nr:RNA polymerase sigma factor [Alkalihalobacillus sp. TS-13]
MGDFENHMLIEELYNKHQKELIRFSRSIARDEKEAEDLLQETFLRSLGHMEKLEGLSSYQQRAWLYKVTRNILYDKRRKDRHEVPLKETDQPWMNFDGKRIEIRELLEHLQPKDFEIVYKKFWLGLNSKQIASHLNIPDSTVRYRLQQALTQLRKQI